MSSSVKHVDFPTLIRRLSPFRTLGSEAQADIEQRFAYRRIPAGTVIPGAVQNHGELFLIRYGKAKVYLSGEHQEKLMLHVLGPGQLFGKPFPNESGPQPADMEIMEEMGVLVLTKEALTAHLRRFPSTAVVLLRMLSERLEETYEAMACLSLGDVEERLARLLMRLAKKEGRRVAEGFLLPAAHTQTDIAAMIGARRETVSRLLSQFAHQGRILRLGRAMILVA
jgi:CRP-like cAMP-binding protein